MLDYKNSVVNNAGTDYGYMEHKKHGEVYKAPTRTHMDNSIKPIVKKNYTHLQPIHVPTAAKYNHAHSRYKSRKSMAEQNVVDEEPKFEVSTDAISGDTQTFSPILRHHKMVGFRFCLHIARSFFHYCK